MLLVGTRENGCAPHSSGVMVLIQKFEMEGQAMANSFNEVAESSDIKAAIRALQIWQYLIARAQNRQIVRYPELSGLIGYSDNRPLTQILGHIMYYCHDHKLPPLSILVVNRDGTPGPGFTETPRDELDRTREDVFAFDWYSIYPPSPEEFREAWDNNS